MARVSSPSETNSGNTRGFSIALAGTILWSTAAIFIRELTVSYQLPPLVLAFWREAGVAVGLLVVLGIFSPRLLRIQRSQLPFLILYALILMLFNTAWTISVALNGAAVSTVLIYSSPAITALIAYYLWKERLDKWKVSAVLLSLAGCVLVSGAYDPAAWRLNPVGIGLGLLSGFLFAVYSIFAKYAVKREINPWTTLAYTFSIAPVFLFMMLVMPVQTWLKINLGAVSDLLWMRDAWHGWGLLALLAFIPTIGGYGLYSVSLRSLDVGTANLIASSEPVFTTFLAYAFLGERLGAVQVFGSLLIMAGVFLLRVQKRDFGRIEKNSRGEYGNLKSGM